MKKSFRLFIGMAASTLAMAGFLQAQSSTSSGYSMYAPGAAYIGFNAGQSNYRLNNGVGGFAADQRKNAYGIYAGGYCK